MVHYPSLLARCQPCRNVYAHKVTQRVCVAVSIIGTTMSVCIAAKTQRLDCQCAIVQLEKSHAVVAAAAAAAPCQIQRQRHLQQL